VSGCTPAGWSQPNDVCSRKSLSVQQIDNQLRAKEHENLFHHYKVHTQGLTAPKPKRIGSDLLGYAEMNKNLPQQIPQGAPVRSQLETGWQKQADNEEERSTATTQQKELQKMQPICRKSPIPHRGSSVYDMVRGWSLQQDETCGVQSTTQATGNLAPNFEQQKVEQRSDQQRENALQLEREARKIREMQLNPLTRPLHRPQDSPSNIRQKHGQQSLYSKAEATPKTKEDVKRKKQFVKAAREEKCLRDLLRIRIKITKKKRGKKTFKVIRGSRKNMDKKQAENDYVASPVDCYATDCYTNAFGYEAKCSEPCSAFGSLALDSCKTHANIDKAAAQWENQSAARMLEVHHTQPHKSIQSADSNNVHKLRSALTQGYSVSDLLE